MPDRSAYKVGVVLSVEELKSKGKPLRACKVDIGDTEPITVVTNASNVRDQSRIVVAPVGSSVEDGSGEEITVKKTNVGGVMSEGMFCDSKMLGWKGGAEGVAATVPDTFAIGSEPPSEKPRPEGAGDSSGGDAAADLPPLFEKKVKLTKEEKKKQAEERKARLKAKKEAAKKAPTEAGDKS